jgi:hypothetical protein
VFDPSSLPRGKARVLREFYTGVYCFQHPIAIKVRRQGQPAWNDVAPEGGEIMKLSRVVLAVLVAVAMACGGGGGGGGGNSTSPTTPPPPVAETGSDCEPFSTSFDVTVDPLISDCKDDSSIVFGVTNGSCGNDLLVESVNVRLKDSSNNNCGTWEFEPVVIGSVVAPQETAAWELPFGFCCSNCPDFECGWKVEIEVETDRRTFKATSEKFRKDFRDGCPDCPEGRSRSLLEPQPLCEGRVGVDLGPIR